MSLEGQVGICYLIGREARPIEKEHSRSVQSLRRGEERDSLAPGNWEQLSTVGVLESEAVDGNESGERQVLEVSVIRH